MTRRAPASTFATSPVLVGTITTLVTIVAVVLSYNANSGLPFVPTYNVTVHVPDAAGLVKGNEVRVGGKRVGVVEDVRAVQRGAGEPAARLDLELEKRIEPITVETRVTVRPRSPLGLKYVELELRDEGEPVKPEGELPVGQAQSVVDLDEVLNAFDRETRRGLQRTVRGLGPGVAGRGMSVNAALAELPPLFEGLDRVAANLSHPATRLRAFVRGLDRALGELAAASPQLGSLVEAADVTATALAGVRGELAEVIAELPATEEAGIRALSVARPVLDDAAALARDVRAGSALLPLATRRLDSALDTGTPVLRRGAALAERLGVTLAAVEDLSADPLTRSALERLRATLASGLRTLRFVAPAQVQCNYLGLWTRNVPSVVSEGDSAGTWFRTLVVQQNEESSPHAEPAPELHANPYAHSAAPGQDGECEAGNEPYLPGQRIGNVPGHQGRTTEPTAPPEGVGRP
jgi:ABC-type transporter Mla subunit MlaD